MRTILIRFLTIIGLLLATLTQAGAEIVYYAFDNVFFLKEGSTTNLQQMHGFFTWTYTPGDFEDGAGELIYVDIPGTIHGVDDLIVTIETSGIEFSLDGSFHDDGVDVSLKFLSDLTPTSPSVIDTDPESSKFDIDGNGFYRGTIYTGSIVPFEFSLAIEPLGVDMVRITRTPDYTWCKLEESPSLTAGPWIDTEAGSTLDKDTTGTPQLFFQLTTPQ